jgi:hypothetical protein
MLEFNLSAEEEQKLKAYDFSQLESASKTAVADLEKAQTAADVKSAICKVWGKIPGWLKTILEGVPFVGKIIKALATVLDALCKG